MLVLVTSSLHAAEAPDSVPADSYASLHQSVDSSACPGKDVLPNKEDYQHLLRFDRPLEGCLSESNQSSFLQQLKAIELTYTSVFSGGFRSTTVLHLYLEDKKKLRHLGSFQLSEEEDLAGEWLSDGTRERDTTRRSRLAEIDVSCIGYSVLLALSQWNDTDEPSTDLLVSQGGQCFKELAP